MNFLRALTAVSCAAVLALPALAQDAPRRLEAIETGNSSSCLKLLMPGDEGTGNFGGFRNTCNQTMEYTHCVVGPKDGSWGSTAACEVGKPNVGMDRVGPGQVSSAHVTGGTRVAWFACAFTQKSGEGPDGIWGSAVFDGVTLKGRCKYNRYVTEAVKKPETNPAKRSAAEDRAAVREGFNAAQTSRNFADAVPVWRAAAEGGNLYAASTLGNLYRIGGPGVPRDPGESLKWYKLAATGGDWGDIDHYADALAQTGDRAGAIAIYKRQAAKGDFEAKRQLAVLQGAASAKPTGPTGIDYAPRTGQVGRASNAADAVWAACMPDAQQVIALQPAPRQTLEDLHRRATELGTYVNNMPLAQYEKMLQQELESQQVNTAAPMTGYTDTALPNTPANQERIKKYVLATVALDICEFRKLVELRAGQNSGGPGERLPKAGDGGLRERVQ